MILGRVLESFIPLSDEERFFNAKQWVKRKFKEMWAILQTL